jgi:hypothetical protein
LDRAARDKSLLLGFLISLAVALLVRIVSARGELWLDEIWSLHLVDEIKRGDVLPSIATDNNHYLNTLYLWLVGPDQPPLNIRAFSILVGTASVAVTGWLQRKRGPAAMVISMTLVGVSYPMVNAGSEARGYAGMMLCALISIGLTERALEERTARLGLWLGISNVIGVLFQPLMVGMIGSLGLWTLWVTWREQRSLRATYETARDLFAWTIRLLIPVVLVIGAAVHFGDGYVLGGVSPFSPVRMLEGISRLFRFLLGLPEPTPEALVLLLVLALIALALALNRQDRRTALYVIVLFAMPAAMAIAHLPNTEIPRYYLLPGLAFLLLLGDLYGSLERRGKAIGLVAGIAATAILAGNALEIRKLDDIGRGDVIAMLAIVAREGPGPITSNTELRDRPVIDYYLPRLGVDATLVNYADVCKTHPRWILTSDLRTDLPDEAAIGAPACNLTFRKEAHYDSWGLSGFPWTLYRAE